MLNIVVKQLLLYNRSIRAWYSCTAVDLIGVISSNAEHKLGEDTSGECSQYRHYKSRQYVYTLIHVWRRLKIIPIPEVERKHVCLVNCKHGQISVS